MNGDRNRDVSRHAVRRLAVTSVCLPLSIFPLGLVAFFLDSMGAWKYIPGRTTVTDLFIVTCVLLPVAGVICGRVALKRIATRPEWTGNDRRIAEAGKLIGYVLAIPGVLYATILLFLWLLYVFGVRLHFH